MMYNELVKDLRENHDKYFARDMQAADAIEELQKELEREKAFAKCWEELAQDCKARFQKLLDAYPKWIPVTERLPEKTERCLVTRFDYVTNTPFLDLLWYEKGVWWNRHFTGDYAVTHWMPLPEPPKEETE